MGQKLAIIIPAYKGAFLESTLISLEKQTNKDFSIYIGDDYSPDNLYDIIRKHTTNLDITYKRFSNNLGKDNLIAHWERCLEMSKDEEYFILFSDDDIMEPTCIEMFYKTLLSNKDFDVYHYDINLINQKENIIKYCTEYPSILSASEFIRLIYTYQIDARMPEFIFKRSHFKESGEFIQFDLAYRSDNATVLACAEKKGIYSIKGAKVLWRDSGINISSTHNVSTQKRKAIATIAFFNWLKSYYDTLSKPCPLTLKERLLLIITEITALSPTYSRKDIYKLIDLIKPKNKMLHFRCKCCTFILLHSNRRIKKKTSKLIINILRSYRFQ